MRGCCEHLEIDTKDICLLCLCPIIGINCSDSSTTLPSFQGLKHLLRYLRVSPKQLFNCSSEFLQSMEIREDIDLKISLCTKCSLVTEKFNKLYQDYEVIQLQFGDCVQSLHESISKGNENPERVRKYKDQMRPTKSSDLVNASIAANLRNETLKKCFLRIQSGTPRVQVVSGKANTDKLSKLPKSADVEDFSITIESETQPQKPKETSKREAEARSLKNVIKSQFHAEYNKLTNERQPKEIHVASQTKHVTRKLRQKLKTKTKSPRFRRRTVRTCNYCKMTLSSQQTLRLHMSVVHPEHWISEKSSIRIQSGTPRVRVAAEKANAKIPSKCPPPVIVEGCVASNNNGELPKQSEVMLRRETRSHKNMAESQFGYNAENNKANGTQLERCLPQEDTILDPNPELTPTVVPQAKSIQTNPSRGKSYFSSIVRKKLKLKILEKSHTATLTSSKVTRQRYVKVCEYCEMVCRTNRVLRTHILVVHSEVVISKFLPSYISSEQCKQGVRSVWTQMFQVFDRNCQFCHSNLSVGSLRRHLMGSHAEEFAVKVLENIQSLPESEQVQNANQKFLNETMPTNIGININNSKAKFKKTKVSGKFEFGCEYCKCSYTSRISLRRHKFTAHPEHVVYKFFPRNIPLESCKEGVDAVLEQILEQTSESGFKCKYCITNIAQKAGFKLHVVSMHAEQIALEAQQHIGHTEHLEVVSPDALACSSTWGNLNCDDISNPSEDINESKQVSLPIEMDFEEESLVKFENPLPATVEMDPLDVDYLD